MRMRSLLPCGVSPNPSLVQHHPHLDRLLTGIGQRLTEEELQSASPAQLESIAEVTVQFLRTLLPSQQEAQPLSLEVTAAQLPAEYAEDVCRMASALAGRSLSVPEEAIDILKQFGFEVRRFCKTTFVPHDPRLREAPNEWIFQRVRSGDIPQDSIVSQDIFMICEVRPKPDVVDNIRWVQSPYAEDPFEEQLRELHQQLDGAKLGQPVPPSSRAAFSFHELQEHVLPTLSRRAGIRLQCMSAIHACILANDHPEMSDGRSTEWREEISASHAIISGRSDRGPIHHLYFDSKGDPYINRGFRLCAILGPAHPQSAS